MDFPLPPTRLSNFLRGLEITFEPYASSYEVKALLRGAKALFGLQSGASADAGLFMELFPVLVARMKEEGQSELWPLLGALAERHHSLLDAEREHMTTSSSASETATPPHIYAPLPQRIVKPVSLLEQAAPAFEPPGLARSGAATPILRTDAAEDPSNRGSLTTLLSTGVEEVRIVTPGSAKGDQSSCLLVDIGGALSLMVLPDGRVFVDHGWDTFKIFDLKGRQEPYYSTMSISPPRRDLALPALAC